jgi:selenocysteine lyase/cysteine desulfurase
MPLHTDFDLEPGEVYLNGAYCTPLPRAARAAAEEAYALNAQPYRMVADSFFDYPDAVRERVARVLGVSADEVGVTSGTGFGALLLARSVRWRPGDRILIGPDEFPTNVYPWLSLEEDGLEVERLGDRGRPLTAEELSQAVERGGVRALAVAAVHYLTGDLHPLAEFARILHDRGAYLFVDGTQAAGAVALDWPATGADAVVTSGYKWLFGPYGTGAIWVRRRLLGEMKNANGNWWATENARDFTRVLEIRGFPLHGRRLDNDETASFLNLGPFRAGLDYLLGIGVAAMEAKHRSLQDQIVARVAGSGLVPVTRLDALQRSPMLYFEAAGGLDLGRLQAELASRRISVSRRAERLRVSPGCWNDESDLDAFAEAVAAARR